MVCSSCAALGFHLICTRPAELVIAVAAATPCCRGLCLFFRSCRCTGCGTTSSSSDSVSWASPFRVAVPLHPMRCLWKDPLETC
jgi:hypothetical protein